MSVSKNSSNAIRAFVLIAILTVLTVLYLSGGPLSYASNASSEEGSELTFYDEDVYMHGYPGEDDVAKGRDVVVYDYDEIEC